jgi:hypothetical protein
MSSKRKKNGGRPTTTVKPLNVSIYYSLNETTGFWSADMRVKNISADAKVFIGEDVSELYLEVVAYIMDTYQGVPIVADHVADTKLKDKFVELISATDDKTEIHY